MKALLLSALSASILLSACGHGQVSAVATGPAQQAVAPSTSMTMPLQPAPMALIPISEHTLRQNPPRIQRITLPAQPQHDSLRTQTEPEALEDVLGYSREELAQIKALIATMAPQIAAEDQAANLGQFGLLSADGGKDVEIELFLFDARYGKKAKFWGIKNAHDFLMAGRSPMRRWLLKLKLEGLFSPTRFSEQITFWVQQADLLRVSSVEREQAWLLAAAGVTSVPDLAIRTHTVGQAALLLSLKTMALSYGLPAPSKSQLETWVAEAQHLEPIIY